MAMQGGKCGVSGMVYRAQFSETPASEDVLVETKACPAPGGRLEDCAELIVLRTGAHLPLAGSRKFRTADKEITFLQPV